MTKIVADTLSCIPVHQANDLGIPYMPQLVIIGDETYRDDTEITPEEFLSRLSTSPSLPKTAAPPPALYNPIFSQAESDNETLIVICPSSALSGTFRSAQVASQDFPEGDIRIIDTRLISSSLGSVVLQAHEWAAQGQDADTIIANIEEMVSRQNIYFLVDTLDYLHKGGRIGGAQALLGGILQVKPILTMRDGLIESVESQRTQKRAYARLIELVTAECSQNPDTAQISISHGGAPERAIKLAADLSEILNINDIPIFHLPPAILVHSGPGALAVGYFIDP